MGLLASDRSTNPEVADVGTPTAKRMSQYAIEATKPTA